MKVIMSLDPGKNRAKAVGIAGDVEVTPKLETLRSKYYDFDNGDLDVAGDSCKISFEGKDYIVGEQGTIDATEETNKTSLIHKLCSYILITRYIKPDTHDNEIYAVLACPLNLLKSPEYKEEYKAFIMNNGKEVSIVVGGNQYFFTIKDITIKSEGSGVLYLNKDKFINKEYLVIDIGGLNMQGCLYINGVAQAESRFTEMTGSTKLIQDIRDALEIYRKGRPVSLVQAETALKDKVFVNIDETRPLIKDTIKKYILNDVVKPIQSRRIDLDTVIPLFIGGTILDIKEEVREVIKTNKIEIQDDPQMASVNGLFKIAYAKYYTK